MKRLQRNTSVRCTKSITHLGEVIVPVGTTGTVVHRAKSRQNPDGWKADVRFDNGKRIDVMPDEIEVLP